MDTRSSLGQHLRRATVAQRQIRRSVPSRLRRRPPGDHRLGQVLQLLQPRAASSVAQLSNPGSRLPPATGLTMDHQRATLLLLIFCLDNGVHLKCHHYWVTAILHSLCHQMLFPTAPTNINSQMTAFDYHRFTRNRNCLLWQKAGANHVIFVFRSSFCLSVAKHSVSFNWENSDMMWASDYNIFPLENQMLRNDHCVCCQSYPFWQNKGMGNDNAFQ